MRWLVAAPGPAYAVMDVHTGWCEALRAAGEHVVEFPLGDALTFYDSIVMPAGEGRFQKALSGEKATDLAADRLCGALWKVRPDVLLVVSGFFLRHEVLDQARRDGTRVVILCTECPYEDKRQAALAEHADLTVVDDPTNLGMFPQGTVYLSKAYRPSVHYPNPDPDPQLACDLVFVGTAYPSRIRFFEAMDLTGLDVQLAGNWAGLADDSPLHQHLVHYAPECLDNRAAADLYRNARSGINTYRAEDIDDNPGTGWSMGPRELEMAACGLFFLREPRGEGDELLDMLPIFTTPADASQQLRWWLSRDSARESAARKAREAIQDRTFDRHAERLLRLLDLRS